MDGRTILKSFVRYLFSAFSEDGVLVPAAGAGNNHDVV